MTTFSTALKLELPGDGQQSGTWGQTTNKNFGTLVEQAITGVRSISMINADYTLTTLNGTSDEARNAVIIATGTNSSIWKIICPLVNKLYVISNRTTGGFSITIGGVTGTSVSISNGVTAQVYCDGTNFYASQTGSAGDFGISGNLTTNFNSTTVGNSSVGGTFSVTGTSTFTGAVALSGGATSTTVTLPDATTKVATTAFVANALAAWGTSVAITGGTITGNYGLNASGLFNSGGWNVTPSGTKLYFAYNGTNVGSLDSSGNFRALGNVSAYATP
jgi:hypothetical protein